MRVCQPGPVAFHLARTSDGSRIVTCLRGLRDTGRPPFFITARDSISSESSGKSRYSFARTTCASTCARSDFKVRREARLFAGICFPDAENMPVVTTWHVAQNHHPARQPAIADDTSLARIIAPPLRQGLGTLGRITGQPHPVIVTTTTGYANLATCADAENTEVMRRAIARPWRRALQTRGRRRRHARWRRCARRFARLRGTSRVDAVVARVRPRRFHNR
jgi:hypothetical protein